jgi:hypothetical protein
MFAAQARGAILINDGKGNLGSSIQSCKPGSAINCSERRGRFAGELSLGIVE